MDLNPLDFDLPKHRSSAIKVVGVGGGGSNAVNYMKNQGIRGVDFIICNTDAQALTHSPVETKIQLGATLTEGLGAGANPEVGEQAALESYAEIQAALGTQTKMVFITAGMGGGTGTGAAPIIAKASRELGILTVGIVTAPFGFEGNMRLRQAELGIERLREHVDSLIVINNNKLREVYGNLGFKQGFMKADEVLSTAARGIAEVITHHYSVNIDLRDAKTVLHNSGTAIMGSAKASGSTRALSSVRSALDSPLLNDNHIEGARYVLLLIVSGTGEHEVTLDEIGEINDFIQEQAGRQVDIIMGIGEDPHLDDALQVTVIATGFSATNPIGTVNPAEPEKVVYELRPDSSPGSQFNLFEEPVRSKSPLEVEALSPIDTPIADVFEPVDVSEATPAASVDAPLAEAAWESPVAETPEAEVQPAFELETEDTDFAFELRTEEPWDADEPAPVAEIEVESAAASLPAEEPAEAEEPSPTMTWTLDWNDEPARPAKAVGLDELLAFEAALRGTDAPIPSTDSDVAMESVEAIEAVDAIEEIEAVQEIEAFTAFEPVDDVHEVAESAEAVDALEAPVAFEAPEEVEELEAPVAFDAPEAIEAFEAPVAFEPPLEAPALEVPISQRSHAEDVRFEVRTAEVNTMFAPEIDPDRDSLEETMRRMAQERRAYLQAYSHRFGQNQLRMQQGDLDRPAFERQGWDLDASARYSQQNALGDHIVRGEKNDVEFRPNNSFLHDNVD
ncbi:MAG: cell division protein FtsZ [Bacteroidetes bacterium]|nr:cell division protein FtsZ [Bacteroidota bacterium]